MVTRKWTHKEKPAGPPEPRELDDRRVPALTAASLRRALADRNQPITCGRPDLAHDGRFTECKWGLDFIKSPQFRWFSWMKKWRSLDVAIDTGPMAACQSNPTAYPGLKTFATIEDYLLFLDSSDWTPRDHWGLAGMWRSLVDLIPETVGEKIRHYYPLRTEQISSLLKSSKVLADTAAELEQPEPVRPAVEPPAEMTTTPAVQLTPPRTDLAPEASRYLETGVR